MWKIEYSDKAARELLKIDRQTAKRIKKYLDERIATNENPRKFGEGGKFGCLWQYRIGDFRVIAEIQEDRIVVIVVRIAHRSKAYGGH